jgi:hypothetical protein|tara:strand:- start:678 stop:923 length:246 start_codon:yes stop_codon:yes gene_type:complete
MILEAETKDRESFSTWIVFKSQVEEWMGDIKLSDDDFDTLMCRLDNNNEWYGIVWEGITEITQMMIDDGEIFPKYPNKQDD